MKISELIEELELAKQVLGDIDVEVNDEGYGRKPGPRHWHNREEFFVQNGALQL